MTWLKLPNQFADDERWLAAGPEALALFIAGLGYCDRTLTDGRISKALPARICIAVPTEAIPSAVAALLVSGFWTEDGENYWVANYDQFCIPREEQERTQETWRTQKARRRQHSNGNHDLCDPAKCRAAAARDRSAQDSARDASAESPSLYPTRPDPTRPDPTLREGSGRGHHISEPADPSAAAERTRATVHAFMPDPAGLSCEVCHLPEPHSAHHDKTEELASADATPPKALAR